MDVITVASMLIIAGYTDVYTVDESALDIVEACGIGPVSEPSCQPRASNGASESSGGRNSEHGLCSPRFDITTEAVT